MSNCGCWGSLLIFFMIYLSAMQKYWYPNFWKRDKEMPASHLSWQSSSVLAPFSLPPSHTHLHLLLILIQWPQTKTWSAYMLSLCSSSSVPEVSYFPMIQYYGNITVEISFFIFVSFSTDLSIISCIILYSHKARKSSNRYVKILTSIFPARCFKCFVFRCH